MINFIAIGALADVAWDALAVAVITRVNFRVVKAGVTLLRPVEKQA